MVRWELHLFSWADRATLYWFLPLLVPALEEELFILLKITVAFCLCRESGPFHIKARLCLWSGCESSLPQGLFYQFHPSNSRVLDVKWPACLCSLLLPALLLLSPHQQPILIWPLCHYSIKLLCCWSNWCALFCHFQRMLSSFQCDGCTFSFSIVLLCRDHPSDSIQSSPSLPWLWHCGITWIYFVHRIYYVDLSCSCICSFTSPASA